MRALLPAVIEHVDVHEHYAAGWVDGGGLRVNFIASVDGAAAADGKSGGLQTPGDNVVFAALRDLADVVLVGAGTVAAEGYGPIRLSPRRVAARARFGLAPTLPLAISSRSLRLDPGSELFTAPTIVLTCGSAPADALAALREVADVVVCGDETVEPAQARAVLAERGFDRILCEGGPTVFGEFAGAGEVTELCLTLAPQLGGPGAPRIVGGPEWSGPRALSLVGLLEEDDGLFLRYAVAEPLDDRKSR